MDESGTQDNPSTYVTFTTPGVVYRGYRRYFLPVNVSRGTVTTLTVKVNYKGLAKASQTWTWYLYDWTALSWVGIGNNSAATTGNWKLLTFNTTAPSRFINASTREIRLQVRSNNASGDAKLDYESISLGYNFTATPTRTPTRTPCSPAVALDYVPPYGSFNDLRGHVTCVTPSNHTVAVYIKVFGGWWTKPYWDSPLTTIQSNGTWTTDITTGGSDQLATDIAAFVIPVSYTPPAMSGEATLPQELYTNAVTYVIVQRPLPPPPANNAFSASQLLNVSATITGTNAGATLETGEPQPCCSIGATVWYRVRPTAHGILTVTTAGSNFDNVLAV
jgi:hypothetical protein